MRQNFGEIDDCERHQKLTVNRLEVQEMTQGTDSDAFELTN